MAIKWITIQQAKAAGKRSTQAAKGCSEEHWDQLATASMKALLAKAKSLAYPEKLVGGDYCALCWRFASFKDALEGPAVCPLIGLRCSGSCCLYYDTAVRLFDDFIEEPSPVIYRAFQMAAAELRDYIHKC